jgi:hypothetical protein
VATTGIGSHLAIALTLALVAIGLLVGGTVVAAKNVGRSSAPISRCDPVVTKAHWMLDEESHCFQRLAPDR